MVDFSVMDASVAPVDYRIKPDTVVAVLGRQIAWVFQCLVLSVDNFRRNHDMVRHRCSLKR